MPIGADERLTFIIQFKTDADVILKKAGNAVDQFVRKTDASLSRSQKSFKRLRGSLALTGKAVQRLAGRWIAMAGTFAGAFAIFRSISDAQKFGIAIAEIGTIFSGTDAELAAVEKRLLSLSETLGLPEQIVAKGFYQIISADITDAAAAMIVLEESADLATVGLADVKQTIDVVTSVLKAYGQEVSEAAIITDVLFQTVIKGKTTISELATSLGQVLPIAATLGIRIQEVTAAIATLTQGGIETNTAVIQLRQTFNQLLKPSAEASEILKAYGINVSVARLRTEGFVSVLTELRDKLGNNAAAYARIFGNIRALIPILALTGERYEQFTSVLEANDSALDIVSRSLEKFQSNAFKRFQVFVNALRIRLLKVGKAFIEEIDKVLEKNGGLKKVVGNISALFGTLEGIAKGFAQGLGRGLENLNAYIISLGTMEEAIGFLKQIGDTIGATIQFAFQSLFTGVQIAAHVFIELLRVLDMMVRKVKSLANAFVELYNQISGGTAISLPFPLLKRVESLEAQLATSGKSMRSYAREVEATTDSLASFQKIREEGIGILTIDQQEFEELLFPQLEKALKNIEKEKELYRRLQDEIQDSGGLVPSGTFRNLEDAASALDVFSAGAKDSTNQFRREVGKLFDMVNGVIAKAQKIKAVVALEYVVDEGALAESARKAAEKVVLALQNQVNVTLGSLAIVADVSVPEINLGVGLVSATEKTVVQIRQLFSDVTGIALPAIIDEASIIEAAEAYRELQLLIAEINTEINTGVGAELSALEATSRIRRQIFDQENTNLNVTADARANLLDLFDKLEESQRRAAIGFRNFPQFFSNMAGEASVPWDITVEGIRLAQQEMDELARDALRMGAITETQMDRVGEAIDRNITQKLDDLRTDVLGGQLDLLRGDEAFNFGALESFQQSLKDAAFAAARLNTTIFNLTTEGTQAFRDLNTEAELLLAEAVSGLDAFGGGFLARLKDIKAEMNDMVALGARLADDLSSAFEQGFQTGISNALLGENSDAVREQFARALADSIANAISAKLATITTGALEFLGEAIFGPLKDIKGESEEALALTQITTASLSAITQVEGAVIAAVAAIKATFAVASGQQVELLTFPAETLTQAAVLQLKAAEVMLSVFGGAGVEGPFTLPVGGDGGVKAAADAGGDAAAAISADAIALGDAAFLAFEPVATLMKVAVGTLKGASGGLTTASGFIKSSGIAMDHSAIALLRAGEALLAAAGALKAAAATDNFEMGGLTQGPIIQGFAAGTSTIPKRLTEMGAGGVKTQELLTRVREGATNEAVVPLPGNGRSIPVEFRNPEALTRAGGTTIVTQEAHLHLSITSDDRDFTRKVAATMPMIERMLTSTLSSGGNRALGDAVHGA